MTCTCGDNKCERVKNDDFVLCCYCAKLELCDECSPDSANEFLEDEL